jgi:hypothetical protein
MYYRDYSLNKYAAGGNIAGITEKDFANNRVIKRGNIEIELSKDFPTHYYAHFIDISKDGGELVSVYANKNWNKVVKEIETFKYEKGGEMADGGMMAKGGKMTNSGIMADIGKMYKGGNKDKIKFIYSIHKRDEYGDIIPKPVKKMSVIRVNQTTAKEVVYKKYPSKDYFVELENAFVVKAKGGNVEDEFMGFNVMINTKKDFNKFKKLYVSDADEMGDNTLFFSFDDEKNANKKIKEIENHLKQLNIDDYFIQNVYSSEFN